MTLLVQFSDFLGALDSFDLECALYVQSKEWSLDSLVAVLDPDEAENPEGKCFKLKEENSLFYALQISIVLEVIGYCLAQKQNATKEEMLAALVSYYKQDAFS